jgi:hypothetical protein
MFGALFIFVVFAAHLLFHIFGTVGVVYGFLHSNKVHGQKWWKVLAIVVWSLISIVAMFDGFKEIIACH